MKLPESVRIGYKTYRIEDYPEADDHDGYVRHDLGLIRVHKGDKVETANTLLHEIFHGCWRVGALGESADEEQAVTVLANQLIGVMQTNPEVVRWILNNANK